MFEAPGPAQQLISCYSGIFWFPFVIQNAGREYSYNRSNPTQLGPTCWRTESFPVGLMGNAERLTTVSAGVQFGSAMLLSS